jgi:hypothetical protein
MRRRLYRYRYLLLGMSVLVMFGLIASGYFHPNDPYRHR